MNPTAINYYKRLLDTLALKLGEHGCLKTAVAIGGRVYHQGSPVWAFTSDCYYPDGHYPNRLPARFEMQTRKDSRLDYAIFDVDALYFEKGLKIQMNGKLVENYQGSGAVKISDGCFIQTYYQNGLLALVANTEGLNYFCRTPKRVDAPELMAIWTMARREIFPVWP